jgi:hypothetical protein
MCAVRRCPMDGSKLSRPRQVVSTITRARKLNGIGRQQSMGESKTIVVPIALRFLHRIQLSTVFDDNARLWCAVRLRSLCFNRFDNLSVLPACHNHSRSTHTTHLHAVDHFAKYNVLAIEPWCFCSRDEKLRAICCTQCNVRSKHSTVLSRRTVSS